MLFVSQLTVDGVRTLQKDLHQLCVDKGFWKHEVIGNLGEYDNPSIFQEKLMLTVGELSEASEELRKSSDTGLVYYSEGGKPEGFAVELADAFIRLLDLAEGAGVDLIAAVIEKNAYNETRPYMHNKLA